MTEENDTIEQIEHFKLSIKTKGLIHQRLLWYLGISSDNIGENIFKKEEKPEELYQILKENNILSKKCEIKEFLCTISLLMEIHKYNNEIKCKIESLFRYLKEDLKIHFSEKEIFEIFFTCTNTIILLILLENNIISIKTLIRNTRDNNLECDRINKFFYPEIEKYILVNCYGFNRFKNVEEIDHNLGFFYELRKERKKEPKIIELIREDQIKDFISFVEQSPINLNDGIEIVETIFETNNRYLSPIEYSALFGSISIFKYLYQKNVSITVKNFYENIIEYAIHGRNYEIIHLLEEKIVIKEELNNKKNHHKYLELSIKMHYNEIFEYFMTNYNIPITDKIIKLIINYRNYQLLNQLIERNQIEFQNKTILSQIFNGFCQNRNEEIVMLLINHPNININHKNEIFDLSFENIRIYHKMNGSAQLYSLFLIKFEKKNKNNLLYI